MSAVELAPCPFCGKAGFVGIDVVDEMIGTGTNEQPEPVAVPLYAVRCAWCGATGSEELSEDDAADKWNRRLGRTCRFDQYEDYAAVICSACGHIEDTNILFDGEGVRYGGRYCPECGAEVVGGDGDGRS